MIQRTGTSLSLVHFCTLTFRGGSFRYKVPYRPPILLRAKPFTYNKRKTILTLWYKKNMDACACLARCLTSVISPTIHQGIPAGDSRTSPAPAPIPLYDVTTPTTNQKPKALDQSEASVRAIWAHITTEVYDVTAIELSSKE